MDAAALRLRVAGVDVVAEYASASATYPRERGSRVLAVGGNMPGAEQVIRYRHDEGPDVALVTETLIAELVAANWWVYAPKN
jgi:glucosamine--fructose-6-phosphate aminotransferase (isomerizing)